MCGVLCVVCWCCCWWCCSKASARCSRAFTVSLLMLLFCACLGCGCCFCSSCWCCRFSFLLVASSSSWNPWNLCDLNSFAFPMVLSLNPLAFDRDVLDAKWCVHVESPMAVPSWGYSCSASGANLLYVSAITWPSIGLPFCHFLKHWSAVAVPLLLPFCVGVV